jgi:hypothetical protein
MDAYSLLLILCITTAADTAPVGFVTHYHEGGLDELAAAPVSAELADLIHWRMTGIDEKNPRIEDQRADFSNAEGWLPLLRESGRKGYPIIDTAVHHSSMGWRRMMTARAGQNMIGADGTVWDYSSLHSPVFRQSVFNYIEQFTDWFMRYDRQGCVPGYINGAEWFYPGSLDYSSLALSAFREWLAAKYGSLDELNAAWGRKYDRWEAVAPPRPAVIGGYHVNEPSFSLNGGIDASYATAVIPVQGGRRYAVSALVSGSGAALRFAGFHLAWHDGAGNLITVSAVHEKESCGEEFRLEGRVPAPPAAEGVSIHCKILAPGTVVFRQPQLIDSVTGELCAPGEAEKWNVHVYAGESRGECAGAGADLTLSLKGENAEGIPGHAALLLEDWVTFSFEAMADWLNTCAEKIRASDPGREISSYIGFVFAQQAQWDYAMVNQRLDISLMNTPAIDVNGIQMCIAGRDYTWATHIVDTARKYGKPVRATDFIDFPYGLYSGFEPVYRGTLAAVQHGMTQVFWYGWKGVPDYSFLQRMTETDRNRLVNDTRKAIAAVEGYKPAATAAQLMPILSYSMADEGGYKGDMLDNGGLYHLMLDCGITPDIWTPYEIAGSEGNPLGAYPVLFLSDCPVLPRPVYEKVLDYLDGGGAIVSSGRLPEKDLRNMRFERTLSGRERVVRFDDRLGRRYWGRLRREQVYGNTPPVLVEAPDPARTPEMRREIRGHIREALSELGIRMPLTLVENTGGVHAVLFRNTRGGGSLIFLVHKGAGRCHHADLRIGAGIPFENAEAWCDFDSRQDCERLDKGILRTPDFAHVCIVRLK